METPEKPTALEEFEKSAPKAENKESQGASEKAASEVYGAEKKPEQGADNKNAQGGAPGADSSDKKSWWELEDNWEKVAENSWESVRGDKFTVTEDKSGFLSDEEWSSLFSWSNDKSSEPAKPADEKSWWESITGWFDFGSDEKESDETALSSMVDKAEEDKGYKWEKDFLGNFDKKELDEFFNKDGAGADPKAEFVVLNDGSKLAKDGTWLEFADGTRQEIKKEGQEAASDASGESRVHKFADSKGREVQIEMQDGRIVHRSPEGTVTEITNEHVISDDGKGTRRVVDKQTGRITETLPNGKQFVQEADGTRRVVVPHVGEITETADGQWRMKDREGVERAYDENGVRIRRRDTCIRAGRHREAAERPPESGIEVKATQDGQSAIITDAEGNTLTVDKDTLRQLLRTKEGREFLVDRFGNAKEKSRDGSIIDIALDNLPEELRRRADGTFEIRLAGARTRDDGQVETAEGTVITVGASGIRVTDSDGNTDTLTTNENGQQQIEQAGGTVHVVDEAGKVVTTEPGGYELTWDAEAGVLSDNQGMTLTREESRLDNGDVVSKSGVIHAYDGTTIDNRGNVAFADGTTVDEYGKVKTGDGKEYQMGGFHGAGSGNTPAAHAAYAMSMAAAIAGKASVTAGDIAALQGLLGSMGPELKSLTDAGMMGAYAALKSAEGTVMVALAHAQAKVNQANGPAAQPGTQTSGR